MVALTALNRIVDRRASIEGSHSHLLVIEHVDIDRTISSLLRQMAIESLHRRGLEALSYRRIPTEGDDICLGSRKHQNHNRSSVIGSCPKFQNKYGCFIIWSRIQIFAFEHIGLNIGFSNKKGEGTDQY
jgi:hypothetical protein